MEKVVSKSGHFRKSANKIYFQGDVIVTSEFQLMVLFADGAFGDEERVEDKFQTKPEAEKAELEYRKYNMGYNTRVQESHIRQLVSGAHLKGDYDWNGHWDTVG